MRSRTPGQQPIRIPERPLPCLENSLRPPFAPTHRIVFQPLQGPAEETPVMLLRDEVWTRAEWDALLPGQCWTHAHEWVILDGEWWWSLDGLCVTPQRRSGEIRIEPILA